MVSRLASPPRQLVAKLGRGTWLRVQSFGGDTQVISEGHHRGRCPTAPPSVLLHVTS